MSSADDAIAQHTVRSRNPAMTRFSEPNEVFMELTSEKGVFILLEGRYLLLRSKCRDGF
jgi:hypothetical protein